MDTRNKQKCKNNRNTALSNFRTLKKKLTFAKISRVLLQLYSVKNKVISKLNEDAHCRKFLNAKSGKQKLYSF